MSFRHSNAQGNEDLLKRLFNKVHSAILVEQIFCPPEVAVYLAGYACQAKFGPAKGLRNPNPPVFDLLPKSTLDNHDLSTSEWEERISQWHLSLRNTSFLDSIVEYLNIAQDAELYGAPIYEVRMANQSRKWISLDAVGVNIYDSEKKPPTKRYLWSEIASFNAWNGKIEMELTHEPGQVIEFYLQNPQIGKLLVQLFDGSKELYSRRKKGETTSNYVRRSESNSSMRMRPHKLTPKELLKLEQQITELELELPRRATNFEYAAWQVKDQLRQARGIETKLSLNIPSTDETRELQNRVAQIRVFLERDVFKEKEPTDRLHRYRGNFAIRVGGTLTTRSDGYTSDIDIDTDTNEATLPPWSSAIRSSSKTDNVKAAPKPQPQREAPTMPPLPARHDNRPISEASSPTETDGQRYTEHFQNGSSSSQKISDPPLATMPALPEPLVPTAMMPPKLPSSGSPEKPPTYNPDAYPKYPERPLNSFAADEASTSNPVPARGPLAYPEARGSEEMDPPASVTSPQAWKHVLRTPEQDPSSQYAKGRIHGQVIETDDVQLAYRPPVQPKPKVAPRGTVDPRIVTPDYYAEAAGPRGPNHDPKFSSLKGIQSGYAKKRIDLFEAL